MKELVHHCKKPFLCSCEVEELSDEISDRLIKALIKELDND